MSKKHSSHKNILLCQFAKRLLKFPGLNFCKYYCICIQIIPTHNFTIHLKSAQAFTYLRAFHAVISTNPLLHFTNFPRNNTVYSLFSPTVIYCTCITLNESQDSGKRLISRPLETYLVTHCFIALGRQSGQANKAISSFHVARWQPSRAGGP